MPKFDEIDKEILRLLQKDGRMPYKDIAEKINKAPATVKNRISKMMDMGIVRAFVPLLNYKALGYGVSAVILIQAKPGRINDLIKILLNEGNINFVYEITGEYDVIIIGRFKNEEHLSEFVRKILSSGAVERTVTSMIMKSHKEDPRIPI